MFTGIIEEIGTIKSVKKGAKSVVLTIAADKTLHNLALGDSIATNGVCLTVTEINGACFTCDIMHETVSRSSLCGLKIGSRVNLERAMPLTGRFGGHIVSGHIDGIGNILAIKNDGIALWYKVKAHSQIMRYIVEKGSITIDGISLTVAKVQKDSFSVSVIPYTLKETTLSEKTVGSTVNLENDIIGKYVEKFIQTSHGITKEFLVDNNF